MANAVNDRCNKNRDQFVLTQCPGCQTVFRITGAILRAAHGQVRCGRCNTQFDAVQNALDDEQFPVSATPSSQQDTEDKTAFMPPSHSAASDDMDDFMSSVFNQDDTQNEQITMEGDRINPSIDQADNDFMVDEAVTDDSIIEVFNVDSAEWSTPFAGKLAPSGEVEMESSDAKPDATIAHVDEITRIRQRFFDDAVEDQPLFMQSQTEHVEVDHVINEGAENMEAADVFNEAVYMTALENALKDPTGQPLEPSPESEPESVLERTRLRRWSASRKKKSEPPPDVLEPGYAEPVSTRRWPLALGCVALSLLLAFQVVHHFRQTLVRHPGFGTTLKSVYAFFGKTLEPRWELSAYSIKQWGIVSDPQEPGILRVRASITNNASFAQPYPLLKLTLEDRFGTSLGMRSFKPAEYLPSATSATRLLDAGAAANVDLAIVDPGDEAVGFQFDSCLGNETAMRCAHE